MAYTYSRSITIDHTKVSGTSDFSNFPILVSITDNTLKTVANGGHVSNSSGYDIIFTSDSGGTTQLDHEIDTYDGTNGIIKMWVRLPTLHYGSDDVIYMWYGDSGISTSQEDVAGTWNSNYKFVCHMNTTLVDSTSNGATLTNTDTTDATGYFGRARSFSGATQAITAPDSTALSIYGTSALTVQAMIKPDVVSGNLTIVAKGRDVSGAPDTCNYHVRQDDAKLSFWYTSSPGNFRGFSTSSNQFSIGNWYKIAVTYTGGSSTSNHMFVNGSEKTSAWAAGTGSDQMTDNSESFKIGAIRTALDFEEFDGTIDEVRVLAVATTTYWELTEYNNWSSPGTFYTLGSESGATTTSSSTSTTTSSSTSTTTTLNPNTGGLAFGEQNPTGETAVSWQTWGGTGAITGDSNWGKLELEMNEYGYSNVYNFGNTTSREITLQENKYGTGQGTATLQIRGQNTPFAAADASPDWENYTAPIFKTWQYIQVRAIKNA